MPTHHGTLTQDDYTSLTTTGGLAWYRLMQSTSPLGDWYVRLVLDHTAEFDTHLTFGPMDAIQADMLCYVLARVPLTIDEDPTGDESCVAQGLVEEETGSREEEG